MPKPAYCSFIDTIAEGRVPLYRDERGNPVTYDTRSAAEREIAEDATARLREFLDGERDFDDAMTVEEYILPVDVLDGGDVVDEEGSHFAAQAG